MMGVHSNFLGSIRSAVQSLEVGLVALMERFPSGTRVAIHCEGFIPDGLDFIEL